MVFADWTFSGSGSGALDTGTKYAGNSSYKSSMAATQGNSYLTHDTFAEPQAIIIAWVRVTGQSTINAKAYVNHASYGDLYMPVTATNAWTKCKVMFWYDIGNDARFGRVYRWSGSDWVQYGYDTNFGTGSPAAGAIKLKHWSNRHATYVWFDELEVSA